MKNAISKDLLFAINKDICEVLSAFALVGFPAFFYVNL